MGSLLACRPDLFEVKEAPAARVGEAKSPEMAVLEAPSLCSSPLAAEQIQSSGAFSPVAPRSHA